MTGMMAGPLWERQGRPCNLWGPPSRITKNFKMAIVDGETKFRVLLSMGHTPMRRQNKGEQVCKGEDEFHLGMLTLRCLQVSDWRISGGLLEIRKMSEERSGVEKD